MRRRLVVVGMVLGVVMGARDADAQRTATRPVPVVGVPAVVAVRDSAGQGVADVEVYVESQRRSWRTGADGVVGVAIVTDSAGDVLVFRKIGFAPVVMRGVTQAADTLRVRLSRTPPRKLAASRIIARDVERSGPRALGMEDFWERRAEGKGRTFTRRELDVIGSMRGAIATVPGARVRFDTFGNVTEVRFARCPGGAAWYLDGQRLASSGVRGALADPPDLSDRDIEALEVYRGSSQLPAVAVGNSCAAIFVWTRRSLPNVPQP